MQESFIVVHPSLTNLAVEILNVPMRDVNRSTINSAKSSGFGCGKKTWNPFVAQNCNHTQKKEKVAGGSRRREPLVS
jgi:hypothetical protein